MGLICLWSNDVELCFVVIYVLCFVIGGMSEWLKETGCKPVGYAYAGSNPAPSILRIRAQTTSHYTTRYEVALALIELKMRYL